jgi:DNA-binding GntR family transcriptional regulator
VSKYLTPLVFDNIPSHADRAYERLREAIVDGTLASGSKVSERGLANALAISAQPIREALRRLEGEGLIETRFRSSTFVARLDARQLVQMGRIRAAMEAAAAGLAARYATPADHRVLCIRLSAIEAATRDGSSEALAEANDAFHQAIHRATGNAFLERAMPALRAYFHMSRARVLAAVEQHDQALAEHAAILAAIKAGDAEEAEQLMRAHTLRSLAVAFPEEA